MYQTLIKPFIKCFDYSGTIGRKSYFSFYLFSMIIQMIGAIPMLAYAIMSINQALNGGLFAGNPDAANAFNETLFNQLMILSVVISCWATLAVMALTTKRLRDAGFPLALSTLCILPILSLIPLALCAHPTSK